MQTFVLLSSTTISFAVSLLVLFSAAHRKGVVIAQLAGNEVTCPVENESVPIPDILNTKCIDCTCKNGMVECKEPNCPRIESCYVLQELQNDDCCKKCKGCVYNGVNHESGTEWTEPNEPCRSLSCLTGVITESSIQCYAPCANPTPPAPGQCCPTCPSNPSTHIIMKVTDCRFKDKEITQKTSIIPKKDPCTFCDCAATAMTCRKKACPVLNCPEAKVVQGFEECCPQCLGSGTYMTPPRGACLLRLKLHQSGTQFTLDPCTRCRCENSTVFCQRESCPILNCKREHQKTLSGQCCAQCLGGGDKINTETDDEDKDVEVDEKVLENHEDDDDSQQKDHDGDDDGDTDYLKNHDVDDDYQKNHDVDDDYQKNHEVDDDHQKNHKVDDDYQKNHDNDHKDHDDNDDEAQKSHNHNDDVSQKDHNDNNDDYQSYENQKKEPSKSCTHNGTMYKDGEAWNTIACESCTCAQGKVKCSAMTCPVVRCPPNSVLKIPEGECCPVCEESKGVCTVFGGSHYRTFDGKLYAFVGSCKYQLASDCEDGTFNVRLRNIVVGNDVAIKRVSLRIDRTRVDLQQNRNTKVNDRAIELPYRLRDALEVTESNGNVVVTSKIGVKLLWNYLGFLELTLPRRYRRSVCGLCGDFDSVADNDFTTREGIPVEDPAIFAQSWTTGDEVCLDTRQYGMRGCNPRKDQRLCSYVKGSIFGKCLKKINVTSYYETCLKDMCECPPEDLQCHCESFSSYVRDCQRLGILLPRWRKSVGC